MTVYKLGPGGYLKIQSKVLGEEIYLVRDDKVKTPEKKLIRYTLKEARLLKGLELDEIRYMHHAKKNLNGTIIK